jgi:hypothetical protein
MAIPSRQIGWGTESNLLWQILKQLNRLTSVLFGLKEAATPNYKVYTALLTQSGGDGPTAVGDLPLLPGTTYVINDNDGGTADFTNVGAPDNNPGTFFVATGTTPNSWGDNLLGQLEYNAGAPTVIVLENTIGNIWFDYRNTGQYRIYSDSQFIQNKTFAFIAFPGTTNSGGSAAIYVNQVPEHLSMETRDYAEILSDDILYDTSIEIRVYN